MVAPVAFDNASNSNGTCNRIMLLKCGIHIYVHMVPPMELPSLVVSSTSNIKQSLQPKMIEIHKLRQHTTCI